MLEISRAGFDIRKIAQSGQCFRIREEAPGLWRAIAGERVLGLEIREGGLYRLDCGEEDYRDFWRDYFDLSTDYGAFGAAVPPEDGFLQAALEAGRGIRILRQDPWEALITFIISQRKNIPAIARAVELLSRRFGKALPGGLWTFPEPEALARAGEEAFGLLPGLPGQICPGSGTGRRPGGPGSWRPRRPWG